ncbi:MAG: Ig domain-containing protein, partial [Clostridia bacterium]|nr:Ig domain-containing protein [Clostridia bacterium]
VESITLNTTLEIILKEQTLSLTATITPENAENKTLKWTSSNEAVATVNENGVVTGRGEGEAIITVSATDGSNKQATCSIIISPDPNIPNVKGFNLDRTYYVTYNENGESAKVGNKITANEEGIPTNIPTGWYNYGKRNWANIVVTDGTVENGTITGGTTSTYYTWIPRYQFMLDQDAERSKIAFVKDKEETTIDARLQIPVAFTFNKTPLTGYWAMKYTANIVNNILQANTSTHYKKTDDIANWLPAFRNMEVTRRSDGLKRDN